MAARDPKNPEGEAVAAQTAQESSLWKEYAKAIVVAVFLAVVIRTFVAQAFKIPSESMVSTLLVGDHLLVNKLLYRFEKPQRGDIIVFRYPMEPDRDFVKRAIGLPGETVEMKGNTVYVNGEALVEPYAIYEQNPLAAGDDYHFGPVTVPDGHLFMMGDNRNNSQDSRYWGMLDMNLIHGKAFIIHWSWLDNTFGVRWDRIGKLLK
ncbi:MAG: signal peptidase I [Nitrospinae bacterium]|nr:signal peptidase I [Nitrospinota bacterium]